MTASPSRARLALAAAVGLVVGLAIYIPLDMLPNGRSFPEAVTDAALTVFFSGIVGVTWWRYRRARSRRG